MKVCRANAIYCLRKFSVLMLIVFTMTCWITPIAKTYAATTCKSEIARIVSSQGTIEIRRAQEDTWQQVSMGEILCTGDMIRVRSQSRAALRLSNNSLLRLDQKTSITFPEIQDKMSTSLLDLFEGAIHIITRTPKPFKIRTPFVNASVEGTEFFVGLKENDTRIVVYEGKVSASNDFGSLLLSDHEAAITYKGQAPHKEIIIRPTDAVQWALYYPVILHYWQGDVGGVSALILQASQLLTVGQADEAKEIIQQVLLLEPNNNNAHALLAIIALVQNEKDQALELASKAVTLDQESAAGYLALSYVQQAHFKIEAALESVQKALVLDTNNALILARLAELQISVGYLERALDAAKLAVNLNPDLAKTQTVLGFAHLLQVDTQTAKDIFHRAIALDQADPMPRLGLGLALVREGELEAGRIELEIAASLDPANSLIRSYLGKAYFEEKRYPLASTQFDLAKERDPKDPTPWFYDAVQKQTQNRPVEALKDIQKSIELNNNRAVYRSKFLLDRDEAARGSSLARIFENLGFERRAVMETAKSLSFDPANHSAHRFLSDTYANMPRHEISRVSELLQAQLLQPINVNPVQPHLAVADLNIITGTGPSAAGFNEFTPLMERSKPQLVASGIVGNNGTLGNEMVFSKFNERTSISLGQFHYETNGFRRNNDLTHNVYNAFIQHAVTSKFNVQAELRTRGTENGDLSVGFDRKVFDSLQRRELNEDIARVGARYSFSPKQDFIVSGMYSGRSDKIRGTGEAVTGYLNDGEPFTTGLSAKRQNKNQIDGYQVEAQYLFRDDRFNVIAGASTYHFRNKREDAADSFQIVDNNLFQSLPPLIKAEYETLLNIPVTKINLPNTISERNVGYIYSNLNLLRNMNWTLGFSYNAYDPNEGRSINGDHFKVNKASPKFGLQWDVTNNSRLRFAWFETVKSALIANQTLEPTQVAGFNQFFDDLNGTRSRFIGGGLDTRVGNNIYTGLEVSRRDLDAPIIDRTSLNSLPQMFPHHNEEQKENRYRAYFYWMIHTHWVIKAEPQYEKLGRASQNLLDSDPFKIKTFTIPLSIDYFDPRGYFASLTGTFVNQHVQRLKIMGNGGTVNAENISKFFQLGATAGFRFPNRRGILSVEGRNLLDEQFDYVNQYFNISEPVRPRYLPERTIFARITLNF
jgi:tetratricopeptide (TPR) repeat protein